MIKIGITGADGYLGKAIQYRLNQSEFGVVATTRNPPTESELIDLDVTNLNQVCSVLSDIDLLIHCAAVVGRECEIRQNHAFEINVHGTGNIAWFCHNNNIPLIYISSIASVNNFTKQISNQLSKLPDNVYGLTKAISERNVKLLSENSYPSHILRVTNIYGDYRDSLDTYSFISKFVEDAITKNQITVQAPRDQSRDIIYIGDVVDMIFKSIRKLLDTNKVGSQITPVGSGFQKTILNIGKIVRDEANSQGCKAKISIAPRSDDSNKGPDQVNIDTEQMETILGNVANRSISVVISDMIKNRI
jgi:UDP-glucose 4-epimerase